VRALAGRGPKLVAELLDLLLENVRLVLKRLYDVLNEAVVERLLPEGGVERVGQRVEASATRDLEGVVRRLRDALGRCRRTYGSARRARRCDRSGRMFSPRSLPGLGDGGGSCWTHHDRRWVDLLFGLPRCNDGGGYYLCA
jgi:histone H3/H4